MNKNKRQNEEERRSDIKRKQLTAKTVKRFTSFSFCPSVSQIQALCILHIIHSPSAWITSHLAYHLFFPISDWKCTCVCFVHYNFYISISSWVPSTKGFRNELSFVCTAFDFDRLGIWGSENNLYAFILYRRVKAFLGSRGLAFINHSTFLSYWKYYATWSLFKV